ncbi:MAG: Fic family protein [Christensenellaceae bacterium]|nr:Fic family protein [Christensenellaceae bacterium]
MTTRAASEKWGIGERRIRTLCINGRIEGAVKDGIFWLLPKSTAKPTDKRFKVEDNLYFELPKTFFAEGDKKLAKLNAKRPLPKNTLLSLRENTVLEWTYNSNAIEGNTLTLRETKVVLEGLTVGGKSVTEHLEVINHKEAIEFLEELVKSDAPLTERDIKDIHALILKKIDGTNVGGYRIENVIISGASHKPTEHFLLPELMEKLVIRYGGWQSLHPIVRAAYIHGEFVKIHPFIDGNGRTARLLMNFEVMKAGYPPIVIKKEIRTEYYDTLDSAHTTGDYTEFIRLLTKQENESLDLYLSVIG